MLINGVGHFLIMFLYWLYVICICMCVCLLRWSYVVSHQSCMAKQKVFSLALLFPLCCLKTNIFAEEAAVSGLCWRKRPDWALQEAVLRKPKPSVTSDLCYRWNICTRERKEGRDKEREEQTLRYSEDGEKKVPSD